VTAPEAPALQEALPAAVEVAAAAALPAAAEVAAAAALPVAPGAQPAGP
jgi:hypothetical protein